MTTPSAADDLSDRLRRFRLALDAFDSRKKEAAAFGAHAAGLTVRSVGVDPEDLRALLALVGSGERAFRARAVLGGVPTTTKTAETLVEAQTAVDFARSRGFEVWLETCVTFRTSWLRCTEAGIPEETA